MLLSFSINERVTTPGCGRSISGMIKSAYEDAVSFSISASSAGQWMVFRLCSTMEMPAPRQTTRWLSLNEALDISLISSWRLMPDNLLPRFCRLSAAPIMVAIGVLNSCESEFSKVLYSLMVLAFLPWPAILSAPG